MIKTLKVGPVYPTVYETFDDVAADLPHYRSGLKFNRMHSALGHFSPQQFEDQNARLALKTAA